MNINIANSNNFFKTDIGVKISENFCVFCLSHKYDIKNKQHEVTFSEGPFNLNFADGSVSFTLAQHKVKLGMFTASGELSIENIDKGNSKLPNKGAGGFGINYENSRRHIVSRATSSESKVKKSFYDNLKKL
jgi:hypothetical protein